MKLKEWLKKNNVTQTKMGVDFKTSSSFINNISMNRQPVGKKLAKRIEEYTDGEVTRLELLYPEEY